MIVLSVLVDRPLYGYALLKQINARSDGAIRLSAGVLYPLLHELEEGGLITAQWEEVHSSRKSDEDVREGRRRKWYRLTGKGQKRLAQRIAAHRAQQRLIDSFLPDSLMRSEEGRA